MTPPNTHVSTASTKLSYLNSGQNYLLIFVSCTNEDRPLSVVRISAFSDFEATHAKQGIGIGSSPIGTEGFAHPSARQRRRKTELVLQ